MRAAYCYGAASVVVGGNRIPHLGRIAADTQRAWRHMPLLETEDVLSVLPFESVPIAVDILDGARSLPDFVHPERAFYVFGGEDQTLPSALVKRCRHVVSVPTRFCMNLAATVNVVLYDRMIKGGP